MQLLLVRHGEPASATIEPGSAAAASGLGADPALTDTGRAQAARLAAVLASGNPIAAAAVSPMCRARETAAPVLDALDLAPQVVDDLAEYDRGHHVYRPVHELDGTDDPHWARIRAGYLPEFVDAAAFRSRVVGALDGIAAARPGRDTVLVVCHAGVINVYLAEALGLERPLTFPLDHVSLSRVLVSRSGRRRVRSVNEAVWPASA